MLRGPAPLRLGAVVVGPDDLVQEALAAEELVEQKLRVVRLAVVEVKVERAARGEQSAQLANPGLEEAQVVVERVRVRGLAEEPAGVAAALEADAVAGLVGNDLERAPRDRPARVEGRVRVDELEALVREARQNVQVVAEEDEVVGRPLHAAHCRGANGRCRAGSRGARRARPRPRAASRPRRSVRRVVWPGQEAFRDRAHDVLRGLDGGPVDRDDQVAAGAEGDPREFLLERRRPECPHRRPGFLRRRSAPPRPRPRSSRSGRRAAGSAVCVEMPSHA